MHTIEIRILTHHLRFDPEAELQSLRLDLPNQPAEAVRKLPTIRHPVAQGTVILIPVTEPAVVQYQQFHAKLPGIPGQAQQQCFVEVQIRRLPAVEQNGTLFILPGTAAQVPSDKSVEATGQIAETF